MIIETGFWNNKRAPGVPDNINPFEYSSILNVFEEAVKKYANNPAITALGLTLTYKDIDHYSTNLAAWLQNNTSLKPGDRIAIQMPNILQYPIAVYAAIKANFIIVNTNPLYTEREVKHQLNDSGAKAIICMDVFAHVIEKIISSTPVKHILITSLADMLPTLKRIAINASLKHIKKMVKPYCLPQAFSFFKALQAGHSLNYNRPLEPSSSDTAILQYTGGTTGVAKGAMLTHSNIIANMLQVKAIMKQESSSHDIPYHEAGKEIIIAPLPLYHIYSFTVHLMLTIEMGNHSILIANPRDTAMFIKMIKPWQFTGFVGLNTLFTSLMNHQDFATCDFSKLKTTLSGGTTLQSDVAKRWLAITGCKISEAYGLTECSPAVCLNPFGDLNQPGTVGLPLPDTHLKTIDTHGNETPLGERGELCVKGPQVMKGYWKQTIATADVLSADGWLRTGDVAIIKEDGFVKIVDRIKDMILISGFNVYPNEIEDVVAKYSDVEYCAAIGVPDKKTGESVKLFVVKKNKSLNEKELISYCRLHLTGYKIPKQIEFVNKLPMTPVGKILRKELRNKEINRINKN